LISNNLNLPNAPFYAINYCQSNGKDLIIVLKELEGPFVSRF